MFCVTIGAVPVRWNSYNRSPGGLARQSCNRDGHNKASVWKGETEQDNTREEYEVRARYSLPLYAIAN